MHGISVRSAMRAKSSGASKPAGQQAHSFGFIPKININGLRVLPRAIY